MDILSTQEDVMSLYQVEALLDRGCLQIYGRQGWYDIRRNGATKRWKRECSRAEIPCKLGMYEAFRLEFRHGKIMVDGLMKCLRERPDSFNPRKRRL